MTAPIESCHGGFRPGRLWSLWDMLQAYADKYIALGHQIAAVEAEFSEHESLPELITDKRRAAFAVGLRVHLAAMRGMCQEIGLGISLALLKKREKEPPATRREFEIIVDAIFSELQDKQFLFIPPHRAKYYDLILPTVITNAFPAASSEIIASGNCIAVGLPTASVFHAMRAAEIGLQAMAQSLEITFDYPLELAEWGKIVGAIEPKINELKAGPRSTEKDASLKFYSEAAAEFRHFNNAWRIRVSHARESYEEAQAIKVFDHTLSFFQTLATRLFEPNSVMELLS